MKFKIRQEQPNSLKQESLVRKCMTCGTAFTIVDLKRSRFCTKCGTRRVLDIVRRSSRVFYSEVVYAILKENRKPMHYKQILEQMVKRKVKISGKTPQNTILSVLHRRKEFVRVDEGIYALIDHTSRP